MTSMREPLCHNGRYHPKNSELRRWELRMALRGLPLRVSAWRRAGGVCDENT